MFDNQVSQQTTSQASEGQSTASNQEPAKEPPLTADDIRRIAREEAVRTSQSLTDKTEAAVRRQLALLAKANIPVTDDQKAKIRSDIVQELVSEPSDQADHSSQKQSSTGQVSPAAAEALEIMNDENLQIEDGDPELAEMLKVINDPKVGPGKRAKAVLTAISAKRARLNQDADNAHLRTPAGGGDQTPETAKSAADYWKNAHKK